jgi:glycogen(starch) synthase
MQSLKTHLKVMASPDYLIECSWEVCNKVGGIYTVVSSKAELIQEKFKDNYLLVGPYFADKTAGVFEEIPPAEDNQLCQKHVCEELNRQGIIVHFGKWLIEGEPNVVLIDFLNMKDKLNDIKRFMWESYNIDSLRAGYDYDEPVEWAYAVGKFIEAVSSSLKGKKICCHFHEWLSGAALLYLKSKNADIASIFTTHATILGRSMAGSGFPLYEELGKFNPDEKAKEYNTESKYTLEKASALNADIFTTVSEITSIEAEKILGRKPEALLPNGLDLDQYLTFEDASIEHKAHRDKIREFLLYYFLPHYKFDVDDTLFYFLAGRYEFRTKGIDLYIKSLSELNKKLIKDKSTKTIVAFIFVPTQIRAIRNEILENRTNFNDIKDDVEEYMSDIRKNIIKDLVSGIEISKESLFNKEIVFGLKKKVLRLARKDNPPLSTHFLIDPNDSIMKSLERSDLNNTAKDRVKAIYYPIYLTGADGLLDQTYNQVILASHLGVFPSYYEPWGYTPLECCADGVANITTDLAGFGRYIKPKLSKKYPGVFVIDRFGKSEEETTKSLSEAMYNFAKLSRKERVENKISARKLAELADWSNLIENYFNTYELAISKRWS